MRRLLAALLLLTGCATAPRPAAGDDQARWARGGVRDYTVTITVACMCVHRGRYLLTVADGRRVGAVNADSGQPAEERVAALIPTVDELYEQIARARQEGSPVRVQVDERLAYPREVVLGTPENDAGVVYSLRDLAATR